MDLYVGTPVDELKGHCAVYAVKEKKKRRRKNCTCSAVETLTGRS